jgi:hypothetical protein
LGATGNQPVRHGENADTSSLTNKTPSRSLPTTKCRRT